MGEIADVVGGGTPPTADPANYEAGSIPWVTPADLSGYLDKRIGRGARNITEKGLRESSARLLPPSAVLLSSRAPIGYVAIAANALATNQGFKSFILPSGLSPEYVYYYLMRARELALQLASGTTFLELSGRSAAKLPIPIAPRQEQGRVVEAMDDCLSRLDEATALLERVRRNLKRFRSAVLKATMEGRFVPTEAELARAKGRDYEPAGVLLKRILAERRRHWEEAQLARLRAAGNAPENDRWSAKYPEPAAPDVTDLPSLTEGWCWTSVDMVGEVLLGRQRAPQYLTGRFSRPYLRVANVKDDALDLSDVETMDFDEQHFKKYCLLPGDILVSEGQSPELVGQSAIFRGGIEGLCFQKTLHRFRPLRTGPVSEFVQLVLRSHVRSGVFLRRASITTNIAHLTLEKFKASPFPLPPAHEQTRIVAEAQRLLGAADVTEASVRRQQVRCQSLRQGILRWAFEGRLVDPDPTDEPASVLLERIRRETAASLATGGQKQERQRGRRGRMRSKESER